MRSLHASRRGLWLTHAAREPDAPEPKEAPAVELQWRAPAECPPGSRVRDEITRFVAAGTQSGTVDRVQVDAVVEQVDGRYVLELELRLPTGALHKHIEADSCEVLASATALVMAVMLDPTAVVETVDTAKAAKPEPAPPVAPVAPVETVAPKVVPPPAKPRVQTLLGASIVGSWGAMPRFGAAVSGFVGVRVGRVRALAVAFGELPQQARHDEQSAAGARIDLWSVGARGCFAPAVKRVDFPLCAGFEGGQLRARGIGLQVERSASAPWLAVPFGASVMWAPVPRFAFGGGVDGWVAATRPAFVIDDLGPIHRPARAGVRVHLGIEVRLP